MPGGAYGQALASAESTRDRRVPPPPETRRGTYLATQNFRRNRRIRVPEVRLIDENGDQAGVVATKDALQRAQTAGLDLVEVAPTARPPVCKILDWGKFNYEQSKKNKRDKGSAKSKSGSTPRRSRSNRSESINYPDSGGESDVK